MTKSTSEKPKRIKIKDILQDRHNANKGTERGQYMVDTSIEQFGAGRSILLDRDNEVIAGNKTLQALIDAGYDELLVVESDGKTAVAVKRTDMDLDDPATGARGLAYSDNRASEVGLAWDAEQLIADMQSGLELETWFREDELQALLEGLVTEDVPDYEPPTNPNPSQRILPLDFIYTLQGADATCCLAVRAGLKYGIQSKSYSLCPYCGHVNENHDVVFIDNDYFDYDHAQHLAVVSEIKPKYATVRDVMSKKQCQKDGIEYFELAQILDWAEELNDYAQNVIVIPKYDCLDKIPEKFMLGYSVPTSHGGTPLPPESFGGRRVHLLGGSWRKQLDYLSLLKDDIVSVDNNYIQNIARQFGQVVYPDGSTAQLQDIGLGDVNNPRYVALAISFGNIASKLNELFEDNK